MNPREPAVVSASSTTDKTPRTKAPLPRVLYRVPAEAAEVLAMSPDFFDEHLRHELGLIRRGRLVFVAHSELERWAESNGSRIIDEVGR